jgi:hypothetical protein
MGMLLHDISRTATSNKSFMVELIKRLQIVAATMPSALKK